MYLSFYQLEDGTVTGNTEGCGCCSSGEKVTIESMDLHISRLREMLEIAEEYRDKIEEQNDKDLPVVDHPAGIPADYDEHVKLMCDLQVLAYQCDMTRVITLMLGREFSGVTYPQIGVPDAHHPITHHAGEAAKIAKVEKINA